ncbi:FAD-dependent oxidoreductase [Syntrophomonas erecta]
MHSEVKFKDVPSPYWIASTPQTNYPALEDDVRVDIAIIGGGIVGITAAYLLIKQGLRVAVIEADRILQGTTGHSTAKITSQHNLIYAKIKKEMSSELAQQYADANENAINLIESISQENNIACDFSRRPAYVYTQSEQYIKPIEDEAQVASELGIKASYLEEVPLPFEVKAALRFDNQAQFHPLKYLKALAEQIPNQGSYIFEQTKAVDIEENESVIVVTQNGNKVRASQAIIASHFPFFDGGGMYFTRMYLDKSYVIAVKIKEKFPAGMFITAEDPGRSLRSQDYEDGELVLVAGEHHKSGHDDNTSLHYQNLLAFAHDTFQVKKAIYRWSTQDCMTIDGVPYVGNLTSRSPKLYVATGFGKWGIANGTAAAMILTDLITKGDNPWAQVYNPSRFTPSSIKSFLSLNLDVAKSLIAGKLEKVSADIEIPPGEARVIDIEGEKVGAYRDEEKNLHIVDTTCTHLGCELKWNNAEKSWDCPCHGSRFTYEGDIVEGPAICRLHNLKDAPNRVEAKIID